VASPINVIFVPFRDQVAHDGRLSVLEWKRRALWDCRERNELVCLLAEKLAAWPRRWLRQHGFATNTIALSRRHRQRVVVLTEGAAHAQRLAPLLPGWAVHDAVPVTYEPGDEPEEPDRDALLPPGRIATLMYAYRNDLATDILVRATGHRGKLDWAHIRGGDGWAGSEPALVVDIGDETDARGRADTDARRREYDEQGLLELTANAG
jgi:hypothetical protein